MQPSWNIVIIIKIFFLCRIKCDPCDQTVYKQLPYESHRILNNMIDPSNGDKVLSDRELLKDWYRANEEMPTTPPPLYSCGTVFPIWLDDLIPLRPGTEEDNKKACVKSTSGPCSAVLTISIKNCGGYYVYQLDPPSAPEVAYCFGKGVAAARPNYKPQPVITTVSLDNSNGLAGQLLAKCTFPDNKLNPGTLLYQVTWFFDNTFGLTTETVLYNDIHKTDIILDQTNIKTLGRKVSCKVHAKSVEKGPPGPEGTSHNVFVGIEVLTPVVKFKRGETGAIIIRPTAGIGCAHSPSGEFDRCSLLLTMVSLDTKQCEANVGVKSNTVDQKFCSKEIRASDWSKNHSIIISAREENLHYYSASYTIELTTEKHMHHPIWGNYRIPDVQVVIEEASDTDWSKKYCQAQDDPHFFTFDKRPYDFHASGVFIMYEHVDGKIEVQIRQESCSHYSETPHCTCGVAVRAGGDIFVIDRCNKDYQKKTKFTLCKNGQLSVHKDSNSKYLIYTPLGSRIESILHGETFMTVQIHPSLRDVGKTRGLCGTLTNDCKDDFLKSDGSPFKNGDTERNCDTLDVTDYQFQPDTFSESWRVTQEVKNLFADNYAFNGNQWKENDQLCVCRKNDTKEKVEHSIDCSSSSVVTCNRGTPVPQPPNCYLRADRKWNVPVLRQTRTRRNKRSPYIKEGEVTKSVVMTEEEAFQACTTFMDESPSFKMCKSIPNVNPEIAINTCILDILLTNSTKWMVDAREGIKSKCLAEVRVNATLQNKTEDGGVSIAEIVKNISCINECLGRGKCSNGTCVCEEGYGGGDCGIDLSIPPIVYGIEDSGLCDVETMNCASAVLEGDGFTEEGKPTCRIKTFYINVNGSKEISDSYQDTKGNPSTLMTMFCEVEQNSRFGGLAKEDMFITGYKISISNDGRNFGENEELHIFNSTFQIFEVVNGELNFTLKAGFCFIGGYPYVDGTKSPLSNCRTCLSEVTAYDWSESVDADCRVKSDKLGVESIVGIVIGAVLLILALSVVVTFGYIKSRPRRFNSQVSIIGLGSETADADIAKSK